MLYITLLQKIKKITRNFLNCFVIKVLNNDTRYPLIKIYPKKHPHNIDLVIAAGVHGEEQAPVLTIAKYLSKILKEAIEYKVNLIIYPCVNPWGFEKNKRLNAQGISCNTYWIHKKGEMAKESKIIKNDIKRYKVRYFLSLHEDGKVKVEKFYLYAFGNKDATKKLVKAAEQKMLVFEKGFSGENGEPNIKNGIIYEWHDGTFEDFMSHKGTKASICTETPLRAPLKTRLKINLALIQEMIEIAGKT